MGDIAKNFNRSEFACECGCGFDTVDMSLLTCLVALRIYFKAPVTINSGCRCPSHNEAIGGVTTSQHVKARAADIQVEGASPKRVFDYLAQFGDKVSLGLYYDFVHIDTRTNGGKRW